MSFVPDIGKGNWIIHRNGQCVSTKTLHQTSYRPYERILQVSIWSCGEEIMKYWDEFCEPSLHQRASRDIWRDSVTKLSHARRACKADLPGDNWPERRTGFAVGASKYPAENTTETSTSLKNTSTNDLQKKTTSSDYRNIEIQRKLKLKKCWTNCSTQWNACKEIEVRLAGKIQILHISTEAK